MVPKSCKSDVGKIAINMIKIKFILIHISLRGSQSKTTGIHSLRNGYQTLVLFRTDMVNRMTGRFLTRFVIG